MSSKLNAVKPHSMISLLSLSIVLCSRKMSAKLSMLLSSMMRAALSVTLSAVLSATPCLAKLAH